MIHNNPKEMIVLAISFLVSIYLYHANYFGIKTYSAKASSDIFNVIFARSYNHEWRDRILVVVANDQDVANQPLVPTFKFHADNIRDIASLNPRAIFVDFVFDRKHDKQGDDVTILRDTLREIKIPIYLAALSNKNHLKKGLLTGLSKFAKTVTIPKYLNFIDDDLYCLNFPLLSDLRSRDLSGIRCPQSKRSNVFPTAAFAMYQDYCAAKGAHSSCSPESLSDSRPFQVFWGVGHSSKLDGEFSKKQCAQRLSILRPEDNSPLAAEVCGYHPEISVFGLKCLASHIARQERVRFFIDELPPNEDKKQVFIENQSATTQVNCQNMWSGSRKQEAIEAFRDAFVVYGGRFGLGADVVRPPTVAAVAGAHFHAMALNNLLTYRGKPKRDSVLVFRNIVTSQTVNLVFFVFCFLLHACFHLKRIENRKNEIKTSNLFYDPYIEFVFQSILFVLFGWFCFTIASLAPVNWIGAAVVGVILTQLVRRCIGFTIQIAKSTRPSP